ncbi:peptide ABC transporter substrate-binding protein [Ligilactobacillus agilis]|uniref:Peptide ABC transporter substrate-binding protein n=1 Tax=Ligilactobacillus agilis TaxID=1601 RepID=A0A226RF58_9LACO|nr:peptide ABC transporter substrate-binding protein [Ligilactobacillus agilis]MBM6763483.1 peptide ABC transporter substrate-binding protein [Ligilactobacillus agilis]MCI5761680.1 peptide ABC transporter substrate-binding protein [Ligilactobacillus agilis]MCL8204623.1 peptide ABC transporter substrate-binding protein [Ligilactobacillus agilis]MDO4456337.1 peptide ABC transporter substrate-binding protein [Ligilactobacillus agilis]MDY4064857.1 peptide ABC transporter substrate-binding protein 
MKFKKVIATGASLVALGLALTACGSNSSKSGLADKQVLNWSYASELPSMDLSTATDTISFDQLNSTMEGIYRIGKNSKVEPGLATKTEVSKDGLTYTFTLRKNDKWSNGDPVTAQDFVYSWRRTVDPKTGSQYAYLFDGIANANDIIAGKKAVDTLGIKAEGKYKLVVTLEKKLPYFKLLMGFPVFFPQNQNVVEKYGKKYGTAAKYLVYNGPFKMEGWSGSNLSWKLVKNKNYWDKKDVKLSQINFSVNKSTTTSYNLYQSKKLDYTPLSTEQAKQLKGKDGYQVLKEARTNYLEFNETNKVFANKKIRQALSYAVNRQVLADKVLGAGTLPSLGIVSRDLAFNKGKDFAVAAKTTAGVTYNKAKAQKLLKEGLAEVGQSKLSFTLLGDDTDVSKQVTESLQSQIQQTLPDVDVSVSNVPFKTRLQRSEDGDFDVVVSAWGADFADPISFLDLFTSDNSYNNGKWKNAEYDKLITASKTTDAGNVDKRWDDMVKASKILSEDQGVAPLYQLNVAYMLNPSVKGVIQNTAGVTWSFKDAYIANK